MKTMNFAEKHPFMYSLVVLVLFVAVQAVGVAIASQIGLAVTSLAAYTGLVMTIFLAIIVSWHGSWQEIGFRAPGHAGNLLIFLPALALPLGNITFGLSLTSASVIWIAVMTALTSGFVEEVIFRGLILRAFLPRGEWKAVLLSTIIFAGIHSINLMAGYELLYVLIQIAYATAIGFGFGAMAVKSRLVWPLVIAHGLGNFFALTNNGEIGTHFYLVSLFYVVFFTGYGAYLMLSKKNQPAIAAIGLDS